MSHTVGIDPDRRGSTGLRVCVHFEVCRVQRRNVADLPSARNLLLSLVARRVPTFIHSAGTWSGPLKRFLLDALRREEGAPERPRVRPVRVRARDDLATRGEPPLICFPLSLYLFLMCLLTRDCVTV